MADLFKRAPPAPTPPPAAIAPPTPAQQHHATTSHLDEPHLGPSDLVRSCLLAVIMNNASLHVTPRGPPGSAAWMRGCTARRAVWHVSRGWSAWWQWARCEVHAFKLLDAQQGTATEGARCSHWPMAHARKLYLLAGADRSLLAQAKTHSQHANLAAAWSPRCSHSTPPPLLCCQTRASLQGSSAVPVALLALLRLACAPALALASYSGSQSWPGRQMPLGTGPSVQALHSNNQASEAQQAMLMPGTPKAEAHGLACHLVARMHLPAVTAHALSRRPSLTLGAPCRLRWEAEL